MNTQAIPAPQRPPLPVEIFAGSRAAAVIQTVTVGYDAVGDLFIGSTENDKGTIALLQAAINAVKGAK